MPSSPCHCHFDAAGGAYPPRRVIPVLVRQGGHGSLPVVSLFQLRRSEEGYAFLAMSFATSMWRGGYAPPHYVIPVLVRQGGHGPLPVVSFFQLRLGEEGHAPSSSCLRSNFDAVRRGIPLLIVLLPFRCNEEGLPLLVVSSFQFDAARGDMPLPAVSSL